MRIYCQNRGMEFAIEKCAMLIMKSGKRHMTDGMELPNQEKIRMIGEKETDIIKQVEMKEKIKKEYSGEPERQNYIAGTSSNGIITWAVCFIRYLGPFLK